MRKVFAAVLVLAATAPTATAQEWVEKMFKDGVKHDFGQVAHVQHEPLTLTIEAKVEP